MSGCTSPDKQALYVIYSGSLDGYLEPCGCKEGRVGGLSRLAVGADDSLKHWKGSALLLEAGDFAEMYLLPGDLKNRYLLEAFQNLPYTAINVTAQDLISGLETLKWAADSLHLPLISANLVQKDSAKRLFPGWVMKKVAGKTVGIIGIGSVRPLELRMARDPSLTYSDAETALREALSQIRSQCDLVVVLCDLNSRASREMAVRITGVDVIISTLEVTPTSQVRKFGNSFVVGTSRKGKALTILTLKQVTGDSLTCAYSRTLLDSTFRDDPSVLRVIERYKKTQPQNEPKEFFLKERRIIRPNGEN